MRRTRSGQGAPTRPIMPSHVSTLDVTRSEPLGGVFLFSSPFVPSTAHSRWHSGSPPSLHTCAWRPSLSTQARGAGWVGEARRQGSKAPCSRHPGTCSASDTPRSGSSLAPSPSKGRVRGSLTHRAPAIALAIFDGAR